MRNFLILTAFTVLSFKSYNQSLARQALIDFTIRLAKDSLYPVFIQSVPDSSSFYMGGLRKGDQLVRINQEAIRTHIDFISGIQKIKEGRQTRLLVKRGNRDIQVTVFSKGLAREKISGVTTQYEQATTEMGYDVRMILTRPVQSTGKLPVLFFIQWLSCDQVETNPTSMDGWARLIEDMAGKSGCLLVRTEKPGLGDSEGPACADCDLEHEIKAYQASFRKMLSFDYIDKDNIIIVGGSIGGALAPLIASNQPVKGIISMGGYSTTWFEHILAFERNRLFFSGISAEELDASMRKFTSFYYRYLIEKINPADILKQDTSYRSIWYEEGNRQLGRPAKYYQQLQELDLSASWRATQNPVLLLYGEYDWIMSMSEQENLLRLLNRLRPGSAQLKILPKTNHHFSKYNSPTEAFEEGSINYNDEAFQAIKSWLDNLVKQ